MAIFKFNCSTAGINEPHYLFIQHGSYLEIPVREQPLLESGFVLLPRGIESSNKFNVFQMPTESDLLDHYRKILLNSFSNSVDSFNTAHATVRRTETAHLLDFKDIFQSTFMLSKSEDDDLKKLRKLLSHVTQCYTLDRRTAKNKFGPSYATFKTPVTNIRICTYFAGEYEAKILSLDHLVPIETVQCDFI